MHQQASLYLHVQWKVGLPPPPPPWLSPNIYCFSDCSSKYRFKYSQNAQVTTLVSIFISAVPNRFKYIRVYALETLFIIFCLKLHLVSNTVIIHALETLFSFFSAVPNRFKYCQNSCFRDLVFKTFSEVTNRFKYCQIAPSTLFWKLSLQFQNIIAYIVRMYHFTILVF